MSKDAESPYERLDALRDAVMAILPNASFGEENDGQVIIYTNLKWEPDGKLTDMG